MAKEPQGGGGQSASQKPGRKPLVIDLPAEEVGRKGGDASAAAASSSASSATASAAAELSPRPDSTLPSGGVDKQQSAKRRNDESPQPEPITPSALSSGPGAGGFASKAAKPDATPPPQRQRTGRFVSLLVAAIIGGAVAAAIVLVLLRGGYLDAIYVPPQRSDTTAETSASDIAALKGEVASLQDKIAALPAAGPDVAPLQSDIASLRQSVEALAKQPQPVSTDPAALKALEDRLGALESAPPPANTSPGPDLTPRIAQIEQDIQALKGVKPVDTKPLQAATQSLGEDLTKLRGEVDTLSESVGKLPNEERVAAIEAKLEETRQQIAQAAALAPAVAADALADALASGRPYAKELSALKNLGVDAQAVDALAPEAAAGLPTIAALRQQFETAIAAVVLDSPLPESTGTIDRLLQSASGLVKVRPAHPTAGADPQAIASRIRGALAAGDLKSALAEWNTLPDAVKSPTADWAKAAEARLKADELVAGVRSTALAGLGVARQ